MLRHALDVPQIYLWKLIRNRGLNDSEAIIDIYLQFYHIYKRLYLTTYIELGGIFGGIFLLTWHVLGDKNQ